MRHTPWALTAAHPFALTYPSDVSWMLQIRCKQPE